VSKAFQIWAGDGKCKIKVHVSGFITNVGGSYPDDAVFFNSMV
jgi:hypothetical protein